MRKPPSNFPENIKEVLLIDPPPRYHCQFCGYGPFHVKEFEADGSKSHTWENGVFAYEVGQQRFICEAFLVTCKKCHGVVMPFVIGPPTDPNKLMAPPPDPTAPAKITVPAAKPSSSAASPPPQPPKPTSGARSPSDILSGKYRR